MDNDDDTLKAIVKQLKGLPDMAMLACPNLGVDYTAGRPARRATQTTARARLRRFARMGQEDQGHAQGHCSQAGPQA